jgi:sec-independent protein translocase protein TatB
VFENVGGGELLLLALVGLFVLGPERLPAAAAWVANTVRTIREYATGARDQLRNELGPEFDELRKPLEDLRSVRDLDPRRAVRQQLFAAGEPAAPGNRGSTPIGITGASDVVGRPAGGPEASIKGRSSASEVRAEPLAPGEAAPFDTDAT